MFFSSSPGCQKAPLRERARIQIHQGGRLRAREEDDLIDGAPPSDLEVGLRDFRDYVPQELETCPRLLQRILHGQATTGQRWGARTSRNVFPVTMWGVHEGTLEGVLCTQIEYSRSE